METHKRRTSKLSLEPNPFERSFSLAHADESQSGRSSVGNANSSKPITLPPVTAINSPLGHEGVSAAWGRDSLRSGPLSPAMLGGPAAPTSRARITPRLGLTDPTLHTGLTPFLQGETHPTVSSILGTSTIDGSKPSPGFQALLRAVSGSEITATPGGTLHVKPLQNVSASVTATVLQRSPRPMIAAAGRNLQSASQTQVNVTSATSPATFKHDVISIKPPSPPAISLSTIPEPQPRAAAGNLLPPPPGRVPDSG
ncbi:hypothetical protein DL89DRAFT_98002 [Linderina pennispora]|uniref:Uncharacterized protein n=1 Tax=Linderina pennispora TaxID=61395 RepID=A0A1Y1VWJ6_9FUNG|nr:uncharacterized protein DL89DRAFT_98002 [Linderina pennispora]ORX65669.1 hypothetical protein DL89DRAFT_98002 [Linderina pennispora]